MPDTCTICGGDMRVLPAEFGGGRYCVRCGWPSERASSAITARAMASIAESLLKLANQPMVMVSPETLDAAREAFQKPGAFHFEKTAA